MSLTAFSLCTTSCKKGQALRIGDQDWFAFGAQDSCHFNRNDLGVRISWKNSMPVNMIIHKSVPERYDVDIIAAANMWNAATEKNLLRVQRDNSFDGGPGNDRKNVIYWMNTWDSSAAKEQARTSTAVNLSRIIDADIKINGQNFMYALSTEMIGSNSVSFKSLMIHEMGHAIGLQHFNDGSGVMSPYLASGLQRYNISSYERSEVACEY